MLLASIALARLAELPGNHDAVVAAGGIGHLVGHLAMGDPDSEMTLTAIESLVKMADHSEAVREAVRKEGGIPHLARTPARPSRSRLLPCFAVVAPGSARSPRRTLHNDP